MALHWRSRPLWLAAGAGAAVAIVAAWGLILPGRQDSAAERALDELRTLPLVGVLVADVPGAEDRLRKAIEEEHRQPTLDGPARPLAVIGELRREHIAPALRAADDAPVAAVMAARVELVRHLQRTDAAACREFSLGGIRRVDLLDAEGQRRFRDVLAALEAAYRSGRANTDRPHPVASRREFLEMLREAGFEEADFDRLESFASLSGDASCEIELRVNLAPDRLPADKRGSFSRFVLAN